MKPPKFEVGDKVKAIHGGSGIPDESLGGVTTITIFKENSYPRDNPRQDGVRVSNTRLGNMSNTNPNENWYYIGVNSFELVKKAKITNWRNEFK